MKSLLKIKISYWYAFFIVPVYPTSIINDFNREPVYSSIFDTSVLKMFNDFRNWRFQMPLISGSTLTVYDNSESVLIIPTWALEEV